MTHKQSHAGDDCSHWIKMKGTGQIADPEKQTLEDIACCVSLMCTCAFKTATAF